MIPPQRGISLEEQVSLLTIEPDGVSVSLTAHLHGSPRAYIGYPVDLIAPPVLPNDLAGKQEAVLPEGGNDLNICLLICHIYSTSD